jgi:hypothetical protein
MANTNSSRQANVAPNMRVSDVEDRIVGMVAKVEPHGFCIEMEGDSLWVSYDIVFRVDGNSVILICVRDGIEKYRVEESAG